MHDLKRARLTRRRLLQIASAAIVVQATGLRSALAAENIWYQNHKETKLWSSAKSDARQVLTIPQWTYLKALGAQESSRLPVAHPETGKKVYVDAAAVGISGPPPVGWKFGQDTVPTAPAAPVVGAPPVQSGPATPTRQEPAPAAVEGGWVSNFAPVRLWTGPDNGAVLLGEADPGNFFKVLEPQSGPRLMVQDALTSGNVFVEAAQLGPVGAPPTPPRVPGRWWGYVGADDINVRAEPWGESPRVGALGRGTPIILEAWVEGQEVLPDQPGWGRIGEGVYIYGPLLRKVMLETPPPAPSHGSLGARWIDVNLTHQTVTAYEGDQPVYMTYTSSGRPGWETREGVHEIFYRKERETMDSESLLGQDAARADYKIENIRWTQYFTRDGQAIHENFWRDPALFGIPSSHGCLGMAAQDALWFWLWASAGTPLSVHA